MAKKKSSSGSSLILPILVTAAGYLLFLQLAWPGRNALRGHRATHHSVKTAGLIRPSHFEINDALAYDNLADLLLAHSSWQQQALTAMKAGGTRIPQQLTPVILVTLNVHAGLGNRLPVIVTGLLMAVFSKRVFMLEHDASFSDYVELAVDADWRKYSQYYSNVTTCDVDFNRLVQPDMQLCTEGQPPNAMIMAYTTDDYDTPILQVNPAVSGKLARLVPGGNVFHHASHFLFQPTPLVGAVLQKYQRQTDGCAVGVQIRSQKAFSISPIPYIDPLQYAGVVKMLLQNHPGNIFIAADTDMFEVMAALLPGRLVWWTNETQATINQTLAAGRNPGSDLSAWTDMLILGQCRHIVITGGSTFGLMAAGLSNKHPVHVVRGKHEQPFLSPWFWVSTTSEPCMWKASRFLPSRMTVSVQQAIRKHHPLFWYFEQCT